MKKKKFLSSLMAMLAMVAICQQPLLAAKEAKKENRYDHRKHSSSSSSEHKSIFTHVDTCKPSSKSFTHYMQLQLFDAYSFPVEDTQFWVKLKVHTEGSHVTLSLPTINFETGQYAADDPNFPAPPGEVNLEGGTLRTVDGFLPACYCPADPLNHSTLAPSNDGQSLAFSYTVPTFADLPTPPSGYILDVTFFGGIVIQGAGTFNNLIAPGPQIMLPTDVSYYHKPSKKLAKNVVISSGATDITQFTFNASDGIRDTAVNDAFDGVVAWAWADNSNIPKDTNTLNCMVAVGKVVDGKLKARPAVQLTNLPPGVMVWDLAVAINRSNPDNIVVSYGLLDDVNGYFPPCRATSNDGGKTWSAPYPYILAYVTFSTDGFGNTLMTIAPPPFPGAQPFGQLQVGQTVFPGFVPAPFSIAPNTVITGNPSPGVYTISNPQPNLPPSDMVVGMIATAPPQHGLVNGALDIVAQFAGGFGDNRGVSSDRYGNIWYGTTNFFDEFGDITDQPTFAVSSDGGATFTPAYTVPLTDPPFVLGDSFYDSPSYCFGGLGDDANSYGLWFVTDFVPESTARTFEDIIPCVGFVPITGKGYVGGPLPIGPIPSSTPSFLNSFENTEAVPNVTASSDGRLWINSRVGRIRGLRFKSPPNLLYTDPITSNYTGSWQLGNSFSNGPSHPGIIFDSFPASNYFNSTQTILFDEKRQALYALAIQNTPDLSQNMRLYLLISRDNGQSWTEPLYISSTDFANRGFQSMALDSATGNLLFGWYDGRHDPSMKTVEYFGAVIPAKELDKLVKKIPLSNPLFVTSPATEPLDAFSVAHEQTDKQALGGKRKDRAKMRFKYKSESSNLMTQ